MACGSFLRSMTSPETLRTSYTHLTSPLRNTLTFPNICTRKQSRVYLGLKVIPDRNPSRLSVNTIIFCNNSFLHQWGEAFRLLASCNRACRPTAVYLRNESHYISGLGGLFRLFSCVCVRVCVCVCVRACVRACVRCLLYTSDAADES